jgi:hypothetical protein
MVFTADSQVLISGEHNAIKLWDVRTGQELRTISPRGGVVERLSFLADGQLLACAARGDVELWDLRTDPDDLPTISVKEHHFRRWVTAPDWRLHREQAEAAHLAKQPIAVAVRLGRYLAAKQDDSAGRREAAAVAGWLGSGPERLSLWSRMPVVLRTPFHESAFPDGIACTGVLSKDTGIAPARLLIGTSRALQADPHSWLNHAMHGGALYRNGEHARALAALTRAVELHGKPSPLTRHLLALTHLAMGEAKKARDALKQAAPAKDAPWEDVYLGILLQPETDAALARAEAQQSTKEK